MSQLRVVRELAGYSQDELAKQTGLTREQIEQYELEPDAVPYGALKNFLSACGTTPEMLDEYVAASHRPIDIGQPYRHLDANLDLLSSFLLTAPPVSTEIGEPHITPGALSRRLDTWRQRPAIVLAGRFDSGKTRIANALLGGRRLPSQYQPTTAIVTHIRHLEQRPEWQRDDVWIMRRGFDASRWRDKEHCEQHRIASGSYDILRLYGTRESEGERQGAVAALVYIDAPVLHACSLIDLPGYSDTDQQAAVATSSLGLGDVVVYTSPANGFLDSQDFQHISQLLRTKPELPGCDDPLANVFIAATHANPAVFPDGEIETLIQTAAGRLHKHLKDGILADLGSRASGPGELRARIFTFWYESRRRREAFETALATLLKDVLPRLVSARVDREIGNLKTEAHEFYRRQIQSYQAILERREDAKRKLTELDQREPQQAARLAAKKEEVSGIIRRLAGETRDFIGRSVAKDLTVDAVEQFIRRNYTDKGEAKKYARAKLLEDTQSALERHLRRQSGDVQKAIEDFLRDYEQTRVAWDSAAGDALSASISIPFDARGAFLGGLAGLGTLGALGAWAAVVGNLGGYILIAKAAGVLSALGLGIGSTAAVSFVATIGGPVTIALGLAAGLFLGIKWLFGEAWQKRLAREISEVLTKKDYLGALAKSADRYWHDTEAAFEKGVSHMTAQYAEHRRKLLELVSTEGQGGQSKEKLCAVLERLQGLQDFFEAIPWRCSS